MQTINVHIQRHQNVINLDLQKQTSSSSTNERVSFYLVQMCAVSAQLTSTEIHNHGLFPVLNTVCQMMPFVYNFKP